MHIVFTMANNSSVPYFNWFAERAAQQTEHRFTFVCLYPTRPEMLDDMAGYGCDCHWVRFDASRRKSSMMKATLNLYRLWRQIQPDVVHSHLFDDAVPALLAARLARVPMRVITKADTGYHYFYTPQWVKADRFNNANATHILAISQECERFVLDKEKANPGKVHLIHHGIPEDWFTDQREEYKQLLREQFGLEGRRLVGTIARLIDWKGYKYIIEAAEQVVKDIPEALFLFVGTGPQEEELQQLIEAKGLDHHVKLAGWVDRAHIPTLYGLMDVYVHAASYEPFGFVIAEAMMNGVPVVSTNTGAAGDAIVHQVNGWPCNHGDVEGLVAGISFMLREDVASIRTKAKETAQRMFRFERMWQEHIDLYISNLS